VGKQSDRDTRYFGEQRELLESRQRLNSREIFGSNPLIAHLGLGKATEIGRHEVFWPVTGVTQVNREIPMDQRVIVTEGESKWKM